MNLNTLTLIIGLVISVLTIIGMSSAMISRTLKPLEKSIEALSESTKQLENILNKTSKEVDLHLKDLDYGVMDHEKRIDKIERILE